MSIVFFGTPDFAVPSLLALIRSGEDISLVVTQPDKLKGRGHKLAQPPVKITALQAGLNVRQPLTLRDDVFIRELVALKPEFLVVVAYGRILPNPVLQMPECIPVNVHASLLPKYRGAAPMQWAIINGEKDTGVTTMVITEKLDTGPVLLQSRTGITDDDTYETLSNRLSGMGASLLTETLKGLREGKVSPVPQADYASYAPPLQKKDGLIDWSKSAAEISCRVRGMHPWPGAFCHIKNEIVKILKVRPVDGTGTTGMIVKAEKGELLIGTGSGLISILELQPTGKKSMSASAFIQGRELKQGTLVQ